MGLLYTKPVDSVHWSDAGAPACGLTGKMPCDPSPLEVTCRNCRRKIVAVFTADRLSLPLAWLRGAWAGDAERRAKYEFWAVQYEWSVTV